jgi:hypothetical protein
MIIKIIIENLLVIVKKLFNFNLTKFNNLKLNLITFQLNSKDKQKCIT